MQLMLTLDIPPLPRQITYTDKILLIGSCFTEHMAGRLEHHKFSTLQNPHGILFNPLSVAHSLDGYIAGRQYGADELFNLNGLWNSWEHHTRFSHTDRQAALECINASQAAAHEFIKEAGLVIITLGSAFQYYLVQNGRPVANNHRAPAQWFEKRLLPVAEITAALDATLRKLSAVNETAHVLFTISPVRHIRDGVVDNNRSKARLIDAVHELCGLHSHAHYFPAYELVTDILRDYRYYDIDMVHPNYTATSYVWEQFVKACMATGTQELMKQVNEIMTARNHRTRFPDTEAHRKFLASYLTKTTAIMEKHPMLDMREEVAYFGG